VYYSLNWLREYVSIPDQSPREIALRLTMATCEVEGVEQVRRCVEHVVVARVLQSGPMPDSDHLRIVQVDAGNGTFQTVCGAPNVREEMLSLFALPGARTADGTVLQPTTMGGVNSEGMLVSPVEIGLGEYDDFIFDLGEDAQPGDPLEKYCPPLDWLIEVDNKSLTHRPDLWGHYGLARELAAIYGVPLKPLDLVDTSRFSGLPALDVKVLDAQRCPRYCAIGIENLPPVSAPLSIQIVLLQVGMRPINLAVDLTNFVMAELAQPLHAFDWDTVQNVRIDTMKEAGPFVTLDDVARPMIPGDLMILDGTKPIAIAGVMGGAETEITPATYRVFLESANFDPSTIRRTSLRLGLRTDAAQRFGRGQPHHNAKVGVQRFLALLRTAFPKAEVVSSLSDSAPELDSKDRTIRLKSGSVDRLVGRPLPPGRAEEILRSLGFGVEKSGEEILVTVPLYRSERDISIPADIVEEVARIFGFDNIEPAMPMIQMEKGTFNEKRRMERRLCTMLSQTFGMSEIYTYGWFDNDWLAELDYTATNGLTLKNPCTENNTCMRTHLLPNLLRAVRQNLRHTDHVDIFEIGKKYLAQGDSRTETPTLAGVLCTRKSVRSTQACFTRAKGIVEAILEVAQVEPPRWRAFQSDESIPWFDEPTSLSIQVGDKTVGSVGIPSANVLSCFPRGMVLACFEIDLQAILDLPKVETVFREPPRFPISEKDYSILLSKERPFGELEEILNRFSHPMILRRDYVCAYEGTGDMADVRSYTFRFSLYKPDGTLTGEEIAAFNDQFLAFLSENDLRIREA